jgi:hypothetical protein
MTPQISLQRSSVPGSGQAVSLATDTITFKGQTYTPDATKAFFTFALCHAFPNTNQHGSGLHPNVIAKSFKSLQYAGADLEHKVAAYHKGQGGDAYVGAILDVHFPSDGDLTVNPDPAKAPGINGVAVIWKQSAGLAKLVDEQLAGTHKYSVSIEAIWDLDQCGFAVQVIPGTPLEFAAMTPPDIAAAGYEYCPYDKAPPLLRACYSINQRRVMARYGGRKVAVLMGGLDSPVALAGVGIVRYPAEKEAKILRLAAGVDSGRNRREAFNTAAMDFLACVDRILD